MLSLIRLQRATYINRLLVLTLGFLLLGIHPCGIAVAATLPSGEQVVSGDVSFTRNGSDLIITQGSQTAIINWDDFSISSGALTQFIQNGSDAAALNRVVTLSPSLVNGTLSANGQIFLINPNGITVGAGGVIDTASFIGSTLDVSNDDFLDGGDLNFLGDSNATITNLGSISGDAGVFLFAQQIDNQGRIVSADEASLATGSQILLRPVGGDGRVSVLVATTDDSKLDGDAIRNSGEIEAAMVTMEATGSAYSTAVNNEGIIRAQNFDTTGGRIRLTGMAGAVRNSGSIDATGLTGGDVVVTGEEVYVADRASIDASGDFGGGNVKIGGGIQGQDASVGNATNVFVGKNATIRADARISGSGGEVITFAGEQAIILGALSATGANGGSGGFVETSGLKYFVIAKTPTVGVGGEWLVDPNNIEIVAGNGSTNINTLDPFESTDDTAQLGVDLILAALTGGADVTVTTGVAGASSEAGDITLTADLDYDTTGDNTLSFIAANDIIINGLISDGDTGTVDSLNLNLDAGGTIALNNDIDLSGGSLLLDSAGAISQAAGTLTAQDLGVIAGDTVDLDTAVSNLAVQKSGTGSLTINNSGALTIANLSGLDGSLSTTSITGDADSSINTASPLTFAVDTATNVGSGNTMTYTTADNGLAGSDDDITINDGITVEETSGSLAFESGDSFVLNGIGQAIAAEDLTVSVGVADADDDGSIVLSSGSLTAGNTLTLNANELNTAATYGGISQTAAGTLTAADLVLSGGGTATLDAVSNDVDSIGTAGSYAGSIAFTNLDSLNVAAADILGDLALVTENPGDITQSGLVTVDGEASFVTNEGNIILDTFTGNAISAFGEITANEGRFAYDGTNGVLADGEINFNGPITTTGGEAFGTSTVSITFGTANDLVFDAAADTNSTGAFLVTRSALGIGEVLTAADITTTGDNITFTSADNVLNVQLTGDVVHGTGTGVAGDILYDATVDSAVGPFSLTDNAGTGDVDFSDTVGAGGNNLNRLEVNTSGMTTFTDDVDAVDVITDFDLAQRGGDTVINGGINAVVTTGFQIYNDSILLSGADANTTTLSATGTGGIEFNGDLNSQTLANPVDLTITDAGTTLFNTDVGLTNPLQALTVNSDEIVINGDATVSSGNSLTQDVNGITIQTYGDQTYSATSGISVGGGSTGTTANLLTTQVASGDTTEGDILFDGDINGLSASINDLVLIAGTPLDATLTGDVEFTGSVGTLTGMGDIVIRIADNVDVSDTGPITSTTFLQEAGLGKTTIDGIITTSSSDTPSYTLAPVVAGGGIQINANEIVVNGMLTANGNGRIFLNSGNDLIINESGINTTGGVTADRDINNRIDLVAGDDVLIGTTTQTLPTSVTTASGAINIDAGNEDISPLDDQGVVIVGNDLAPTFITANGADNGVITVSADNNDTSSILIHSARVAAFGAIDSTVEAAISMVALNDIIIGDPTASSVSSIITRDGGIDLTVSNATTGDAAEGLLVQGSDSVTAATAVVSAGGIDNGDVGIAALADASVDVLGGDIEAASATIFSADDTTITVNHGDITVAGGDALDAAASITSAGAQDIDITAGNIQVLGSDVGEAAIAIIAADETQGITLHNGDIDVLAGDGLVASATISSSLTQTIEMTRGDMTLSGGDNNESVAEVLSQDEQFITLSAGDMLLTGGAGVTAAARIIADNNQIITLEDGDLTATGGSGFGSFAILGAEANQTVVVSLGDVLFQAGSGVASLAGIVLDGDGTQLVTVGNDTDDGFGNLTITAGSGDSALAGVRHTGIGDQTVSVDNNLTMTGGIGSVAGAAIDQLNSGNQSVILGGATGNGGFGDLLLSGGNGFNSAAYIFATDALTQDVIVQGGDLTLLGNTNALNDGAGAIILSLAATTTQTIDVSGGSDITLTAGVGDYEVAQILSEGVQNIDAAGVIYLTGGTGAGTGSFAEIRAVGTQTINAQNTNDAVSAIRLLGGTSTGSDDYALIIGGTDGTSTQTITTADGNITLFGQTGNSSAPVGGSSSEFGAAIINNGLEQTIDINGAGDLLLTGGSVDNSAAVIEMTNPAATADQVITVGETSGDLILNGGTGEDAYALIRSQGTGIAGGDIAQVIQVQDNIVLNGNSATSGASLDGESVGAAIVSDGSQNIDTLTDGNITITGGDVLGSAALIASTSATGDQFINVGGAGNLSVLGGVGRDADSVIRSAGLNQGIVVSNGNLVVDAGDATNSGSDALIAATNTGAALQSIDVEGTISVLGGDGGDENAAIQAAGFDAAPGLAQDINALSGILIQSGDATGSNDASIESTGSQGRQRIVVQNNNLEVLGGTGADADAKITSNGTDGGVGEQAQRIIVQSGNLSVTASTTVNGADATIASFGANQSQFIDVNGTTPDGTLTVTGGAFGAVARISSAGAQDIEVENEIDINALLASSGVEITAVDTQNITSANANIDVTASGTDATVDITAGLAQTIDAATSIDLVAAHDADLVVQNTLGNQELLAGTDITVDADSAATVLVQADSGLQTLDADTTIDLNADGVGSVVTVNSDTNDQVITSTGVTKLSGTNGGRTVLSAINSTLDNAGGVWTGNARIGTAGEFGSDTETVTINNSGAITVADVDPAHIHVLTEGGGETIFLNGVGVIGGTGAGERVVTSAGVLDFDNASKIAALDERVGNVAIEGTIDSLNLILSDTGDLLNSGNFTANTATLLTTDGSIDLSGADNDVGEFLGLIANNGNLYLNLIADAILGNRAVSADIPAGEGVYGDLDINIDSTNNITVTADEVRSTGGDITVDAALLTFDAENASTGGVTGPIGAVGTVTTDAGSQTYNAPVVLATNTLMTASDTITFNDTAIGPAGLELVSVDATFNGALGTLNDPLGYLLLNSDTTEFAATSASGLTDPGTIGGDDADLTGIIGGSLINTGTMEFTGNGDNYTFIVDAATVGIRSNPDAVFMGGTMDTGAGNTLTVFGGASNSVTGTAFGGDPEYYASWEVERPLLSDADFLYRNGNIFQAGAILYRDGSIFGGRDNERIRRLGRTKATEVSYEADDSANLAGSLPDGYGRAGGLSASSFDYTSTTHMQTVFDDTVILP